MFNKETFSVVVAIQGKMNQLRDFASADYYDMILVFIDSDGEAMKAITVTQANDLAIDMLLAPGAIINVPTSTSNENYYVAGFSVGYHTQMSTMSPGVNNDFDTFIYQIDFNSG